LSLHVTVLLCEIIMSAVFELSQRKLNFHAARWRVMRKDEAKVKKNYISEHRKNAEFVQMEEDVNDSFMKKMDEMRQEISEQVTNLKMECMNTCENVNLLIEKMHDSDEKFLKVGSFKEETDNKFRMLDEKVTAKMDAVSSNAVFKMLHDQLGLHSEDFKSFTSDLTCTARKLMRRPISSKSRVH